MDTITIVVVVFASVIAGQLFAKPIIDSLKAIGNLNKIQEQINALKMDFQQFKAEAEAKIATLQAAITDERAQVLAVISTLETSIADLRVLIENGGAQPGEQLALLNSIEAATANVRGIYEPPVVIEEEEETEEGEA
jgi:NADP-dependent 3-hydroxy acid dehydrogenase YdfG